MIPPMLEFLTGMALALWIGCALVTSTKRTIALVLVLVVYILLWRFAPASWWLHR